MIRLMRGKPWERGDFIFTITLGRFFYFNVGRLTRHDGARLHTVALMTKKGEQGVWRRGKSFGWVTSQVAG